MATTGVNDVYRYIETSLIDTTWSLVRRRLMDSDGVLDQLIVVAEDGGGIAEEPSATGIGDAALREVGVLVTVRAAAWDGDSSFAKANAIRSALHGQRNISLTAAGDTYFGIRALTPEPVFTGFDGQSRPIHTIAFRLLRSA